MVHLSTDYGHLSVYQKIKGDQQCMLGSMQSMTKFKLIINNKHSLGPVRACMQYSELNWYEVQKNK